MKAASNSTKKKTHSVAQPNTKVRINTSVASDQTSPSIAMADDGRFVVVWQSKDQDGDGEGVYGQLYGANQGVIGDEFLITTTTAAKSRP